MSWCPCVPVSLCPGVPVSRCPGVPVSRGPGVPGSRGPGGVSITPSPPKICLTPPTRPVSAVPPLPIRYATRRLVGTYRVRTPLRSFIDLFIIIIVVIIFPISTPPRTLHRPSLSALFAEVRTRAIFQKISSKSLSFNMAHLGGKYSHFTDFSTFFFRFPIF